MTYGGIVGGFLGASVGAIVGKKLSPEGKTNEVANSLLGGGLGAALGGIGGAYAGKYFYGDHPENRKLKQMILPKNDIGKFNLMDLDLGNSRISIEAKLEAYKKYHVPTGNLPEKLKKVMNKPVLIEHKVQERYINLKDNKTIYIPEFTIIEQTFENFGGANAEE